MKGRYRYRNKKSRDDKIRRTSQSTVLKSGYTVNQTWKGLRKAWLGYTIANNKGEDDRLVYYAKVIQKLRKELDIPPASFPHLEDKDITKEKKGKIQQEKEFKNDNNHKKKSRVY